MKKLVLLSLLLACQSLYAAPAAKPSPVVKTQSSSKVPAKKAAAEKKNEKANSVADKKAVETAQKKAATVAAVKPERQKKTETAHNGRKDKASEKKRTLVKQEKPQKGSDKRQPASQKVVAQKTDKANHKKDKAGKKVPAVPCSITARNSLARPMVGVARRPKGSIAPASCIIFIRNRAFPSRATVVNSFRGCPSPAIRSRAILFSSAVTG